MLRRASSPTRKRTRRARAGCGRWPPRSPTSTTHRSRAASRRCANRAGSRWPSGSSSRRRPSGSATRSCRCCAARCSPRHLHASSRSLFALVEEVNDEAIALLGDNSEDPSRADMDAVLPALIESQGLPTVTLMVAAYACSDAECQAGDGRDPRHRRTLRAPDPPPPEVIDEVEVVGVTPSPESPTIRPGREAGAAQGGQGGQAEAEPRKEEAAAAQAAGASPAPANQQRSPKS